MSVPLKSVEVEVEVKDHVATVVSTLLYQNKEDKPLEVVFKFPLPGDAAVCHFSAKIGQTQIVAEVKEKKEVSWTERLTLCTGAELERVNTVRLPDMCLLYSYRLMRIMMMH